jgi:hypothetical protein
MALFSIPTQTLGGNFFQLLNLPSSRPPYHRHANTSAQVIGAPGHRISHLCLGGRSSWVTPTPRVFIMMRRPRVSHDQASVSVAALRSISQRTSPREEAVWMT